MKDQFRVVISMICLSLLSSCADAESPQTQAAENDTSQADGKIVLGPAQWPDKSAKIHGRNGAEIGAIYAKNGTGGVLLRVQVSGLSEGWHGIHLHQIGDCSDRDAGFKASGGHIDHDDKEHGLLNPNGSELADIPNIYANSDGQAVAAFFRTGVTLFHGDDTHTALIDDDGFAIVIHENPDDHLTQAIGGAGGRVACAAFTGE